MKNVIIGTAGHIDHGKTTLIKAITGRETDRLEEEKKRGISIELGFTYFQMPSGRRAGIIDVPGHEKFIKNMLAGVSGVDIVMFVVAADEGVMPQTLEHLNILDILNIKKGVIVLTKSDMVDEDWLELVKDDVRSSVEGTFLESAEMFCVSSITKEGIDDMISAVDKMTAEIEDRNVNDTPRLPVDRSFTIKGFGTVVTGTLISGQLNIGDEVEIYPKNLKTKIRSIQVHGESEEIAVAGQRVAINLANVKKEDIDRGDVIASVDSMKSTMMLDVKLKLLKDSPRAIENRTRVRMYLGSSEVLGRVVLLDRDILNPGEECYAQMRLEETITAKREDKFVIRFYSPMITIGGGFVIDAVPPKRKRFKEDVIEDLKIKEGGDQKLILEKIIKDSRYKFPTISEIAVLTANTEENTKEKVYELKEEKKLRTYQLLKEEYVIHEYNHVKLKNEIKEGLIKYHFDNPLKNGMLKEEIRSKYLGEIKSKVGETYINSLVEEKEFKQIGKFIAENDFEVKLNSNQEKIRQEIESFYNKDKFTSLKSKDIKENLGYNDIDDFDRVYNMLLDMGVLMRVKEDIIIHTGIYEESREKLIKYLKENNTITVAEFRDVIGASRKYAVTLLEDFDQKRITKREGDERKLY